MQSCNSKTIIDDKESCGLQCISYHTIKNEEDKATELKYHNECVDQCIKDKNNEPTPLGCFEDNISNRELVEHIGDNLTVE